MSKNDRLDERILDLINEAKEQEKPSGEASENLEKYLREESSIYTWLIIDGEFIDFDEYLVIENKVIMMVPNDFEEMDEETARMKYPSEQRPKTILTDSTGTINILFNWMDEEISNNETESFRDSMIDMFNRLNPAIEIQSTGMEVISGNKNVAYMEFVHPVLDGNLYNLMFFLELEGRILMGIFNCRTQSMEEWKGPAFEMMESIVTGDFSALYPRKWTKRSPRF